MEQPEHRERWDNPNTANDEAIWAHGKIGQTERGEAWANSNTAREWTAGRQEKMDNLNKMKDGTIWVDER